MRFLIFILFHKSTITLQFSVCDEIYTYVFKISIYLQRTKLKKLKNLSRNKFFLFLKIDILIIAKPDTPGYCVFP